MTTKFNVFENNFFNAISGMLKTITKERTIENNGSGQFTVNELLVIPNSDGNTLSLEKLIKQAFNEAKEMTLKKYNKKEILANLLSQLTQGERDKFWMIFKGHTIQQFPKKDIDQAIKLCERTLKPKEK